MLKGTIATIASTMLASSSMGSPVLYGVDNTTDTLITIDVDTGARSPVGSLGLGVVGINSLTYDPATDSLLSVEIIADELIRIDPSTGLATSIGSIGFDNVVGLELDTASGVLYGYTLSQEFISIDPSTGQGTLIGQLGVSAGRGLTIDRDGSILFFDQDRELHEINPMIGAATPVASAQSHAGLDFFDALTYDSERDALLVISDSFYPRLVTLDGTDASLLSSMPTGSGQISAIAYVIPAPATMGALTGFIVTCVRRRRPRGLRACGSTPRVSQ